MRETYYVCVYRFEDKELRFIKETEIQTIYDLDIGKGFWVNEDFEYTKLSDNVFWIPTSQVLCVKKKTREIL
jgi:hypothetical protein